MAEWIGRWTVNVAVSSVQGLLVDVEQTHAYAFAHHSGAYKFIGTQKPK